MSYDIAYDTPNEVRKRRGTCFPKPVQFSSGIINDENSAENLSPMQITPAHCKKIDKDRIRSPLKRTRIAMSPMEEGDNVSPKKKRALGRSSTVPTRLFPTSKDSPCSHATKYPKGNLSRSLGRKAASSVRSMFAKEKKRGQIQSSSAKIEEETRMRALKASMLAMLLVHKKNMPLVQGLVSGVNVMKLDELVEELFDFFDGHNQIKNLIDFMVKNEVKNTTNYPTLFRETSCATKIIGLVFKREGNQFLQEVLYPHIREIVDNSTDYEIDPTRLESEDSQQQNQEILVQKCSDILDDINSNIEKVSPKMSHIMRSINKEVTKKWDTQSGKISVNSFFFLRYVCPCLVTPTFIQIQPNQRRALILVSKVLQTLSNNLDFGDKEDYMKQLNDSIPENIQRMDKIFNTLQTLRTFEVRTAKEKTEKYFKSAELLQQKVLFHQHSILPLLQDEYDIDEFKEAISIFSNGKAQQIMKVVAEELKSRGD